MRLDSDGCREDFARFGVEVCKNVQIVRHPLARRSEIWYTTSHSSKEEGRDTGESNPVASWPLGSPTVTIAAVGDFLLGEDCVETQPHAKPRQIGLPAATSGEVRRE